MRLARATLALLAILLAAPTAHAWTVRPPRAFSAGPIAVDSRRDVFAAVTIKPWRYQSAVAIVKLGHANGAELWRRGLRADGRRRIDYVHDLKVAGNDDVVAAGTLNDRGVSTFFVGRLAGEDGSVRWRRLIRARDPFIGLEVANAVALDASGDVIAGGSIANASVSFEEGLRNEFAVVKLAGDSGEERWRFPLNGSAHVLGSAETVAADGAGDVIAAGYVNEGSLPAVGSVITAMKLAGDDGSLIWRRDIETAESRVFNAVVDDVGDVLVTTVATQGEYGRVYAVFKLAGATGEPLWMASLGGMAAGAYPDQFAQVDSLPSGDAVAVSRSASLGEAPWLTAVRLDAATGAERWRQTLRGSDGWGTAAALATSSNEEIVVGGQLRNLASCYDAVVARVNATDGRVLELNTIDGTATASQCNCEPVKGPKCRPPGAGIDRDRAMALAVDDEGGVAVSGILFDGPHGRQKGFVASLPDPATAASAAPPAPRSFSANRP